MQEATTTRSERANKRASQQSNNSNSKDKQASKTGAMSDEMIAIALKRAKAREEGVVVVTAEEKEEERKRKAEEARRGRRMKRKSRWGSTSNKTITPLMPTVVPAGMTKEQEKIFLLRLRIDELGTKIRTNHVPEDRSPSPEPVYNQQGQRLNTAEIRYKQKYEKERHELIEEVKQLDPSFKPPPDYKPPDSKLSDRVSIPQDEYPAINFMGLLIGPRGHTLKKLERQTEAKIMIRGKGTVKAGKGAYQEREVEREREEGGREAGREGGSMCLDLCLCVCVRACHPCSI